MNYKEIGHWYSGKLEKALISSLEKKGLEIMTHLKQTIENYIYNTYTPFAYERTMELYDSMKMKVEKQGNTYILCVYIEDKKHSYNSTWRYRKPSTYPEIFEKFKEGFYGRDRGYDVMGDENKYWIETRKAFNDVLNELKKKGIMIK